MTEAPISVDNPPAIDFAFPRAADVFDAVVVEIPQGAWHNDTPCAGWTARDVVGHVIGTMRKASTILHGKPFPTGPSHPGEAAGHDPLAAWRASVQPVREALRTADTGQEIDTPHGRRSVAGALAFPTADLVVHSWDLARATDQPALLPDDLLAHVVATCRQVPEDTLRGPHLFGPAQPPPDGGDDTTTLMAWLGRAVPH